MERCLLVNIASINLSDASQATAPLRRGVPWCVSTEADIPLVRAKNLSMLRTSIVAKELDWLMGYMSDFIHNFNYHWKAAKRLLDIINDVSADLKLEANLCQMLFGRAVWLQMLPVDLDSEFIHHHYPLRRIPIGDEKCLA